MIISFTAEEYKTLVLMVYLGNWVVNAHRVDTEEDFEKAASRLYSHGKSAGASDLVERDPDNGRYYPRESSKSLRPIG